EVVYLQRKFAAHRFCRRGLAVPLSARPERAPERGPGTPVRWARPSRRSRRDGIRRFAVARPVAQSVRPKLCRRVRRVVTLLLLRLVLQIGDPQATARASFVASSSALPLSLWACDRSWRGRLGRWTLHRN